MDDIFTMSFSSSIVMSQNKMATLVQGLCTGNHWESRIVVYYDNIYKIEKELRWGIAMQYDQIHIMSIFLYTFKIYGLLSC